jgi:hypothetical protein
MEVSCEHGNELSGSIKSREAQLVASQEGLGSMKLVSYLNMYVDCALIYVLKLKVNSVALVRKRTISTERSPLVDEVSANVCG